MIFPRFFFSRFLKLFWFTRVLVSALSSSHSGWFYSVSRCGGARELLMKAGDRSREGPHFFDAEKLRRNGWWNKAADAGQKEGRGTRRGRPWVAMDRPKNGLQDSDEVGLLQVNFLYHGTSDNLTWNILKFVLNLKFLFFHMFDMTLLCSKLTFSLSWSLSPEPSWLPGICLYEMNF